MIKETVRYLKLIVGINPKRIVHALAELPTYRKSCRTFRLHPDFDTQFPLSPKRYPCLLDRQNNNGGGRGHYFYQDLWVAQQIAKDHPIRHIDIGSRVDGFVTHVASFREIEAIDIRPIVSDIDGVRFMQADMMSPLPTDMHEITDSLSCLHALEHFGLGRYGDPIDPKGHIKGLENLYRIVKKGGTLYLSVPMGEQRIEFNAHRIFSLQWLVAYLSPYYEIATFSYVDDAGVFHKEIPIDHSLIQTNGGCNYGCAIFKLIKR